MNTTTTITDVQSIIGQQIAAEYLYQDQADELRAADVFEGYDEWSAEIESAAWTGAKTVGGLLIKKACEHTNCPHTRCERGLRLGGLDL